MPLIATDPVGGAARNTRLQRQLTVLDTDRKALDASLVRLTALAVAEPAVRTFVKDTRSAEQTFFDIIDTSVRPAIDPLDVPGLRAAVASLDTPYEAQRVAADRVSAWAKVRVLTRERSTDDAETDGEVVNLRLAKHRNGPTGEVKLWFRKSQTRFVSYAGERYADVAG